MFSPMVSSPLTRSSGSCRGASAEYWAYQRRGALGEGGAVVLGPPVAQPALAVAGGALVVEAVADLVADHRADRAVVDGVVGVGVEERRLQDGCGEDDLVAQRVVVGVDRLRRHQPLVLAHRAAELAELVGRCGTRRPAARCPRGRRGSMASAE